METTVNNIDSAIENTPQLSELTNVRTWDSETGIFGTQTGYGIAVEILPLIGLDEADLTIIETLMGEIELDNMTVQVVNWASGRISEAIQRWQNGRTDSTFSTPREETFRDAVKGEKFKSITWRPRHYRVFLIIQTSGVNLSRKQEDNLTRLVDRVVQTFSTMGTQCRKMNPDQMIALLTDILSPNPNIIKSPKVEWAKDDFVHEQVLTPGLKMNVKFNQLLFTGHAEMAGKCFFVKRLPETWPPGASASLIGDIFRPTSFCGHPVLQSIILKKAKLSAEVVGIKASRADKLARSPMRFVSPHSVEDVKDYVDVGTALSAGQTIVTIHYQVALFAEPDAMSEAETRLHGLYERQGFHLIAEDGMHLPALSYALPFGGSSTSIELMKRYGRTRTVKLSNAVALMPFYGEWQGNDFNKPSLMLLAGRRGQLAGWTPFESDSNYNTCIIGQSGQGKSVAMQEIMAALMSIGGNVVVIDDGYSFQNSSAVLGGSHVDFGETLELNPFAAIDIEAVQNDSDFAETAYSMLVNFICALCHPGKTPSDLERAILTDTILSCWQKKKVKANIDDIVLALNTRCEEGKGETDRKICEELITLLGPFMAEGTYGRMFAEGCSVKMDASLMVFEMSHLREKIQVQAASMVLLIFLSTQLMYNSPREKPVAIMIDEAWALLSGATSDFIEGVARRARKYNGALITATQGIEDYFISRASEAAWANSTWRIFLKMQDASIQALKNEERVVCDDVLERGLRSLHSVKDSWSEMIIHGQSGWDIARLILDPVSLTAFSSSGDDVSAITEMISEGMSRTEAIKALAAKKQEAGDDI
jgi:conjugal transfer ATP-binding protein TraC